MIIGKYRITKRGYVVFGSFGITLLLVGSMGIQKLSAGEAGQDKTEPAVSQTQSTDNSAAGVGETNAQNTTNSDSSVSDTSVSIEEKNKVLSSSSKTIYFKPDKYELSELYYSRLDEVINVAKRFKDASIIIEGHYNGYPEFKASEIWMSLAQNRAEMVEAYLISQGIGQERIKISNLGCTVPVNKDNTWQEIEKNRRVEVYFELFKR